MKKTFWAVAALATALPAGAQRYAVQTPGMSLVIEARQGAGPRYLYFGEKLLVGDVDALEAAGASYSAVYPAYGMWTPSETALALTHADGNMTTDLAVTEVATTQNDTATTLTLHLKDKVYPLYVDVHYRAYKDVDMIETWTDIRHEEKKPVLLTQYASAALPVWRGQVWLSSLYGGWGNEAHVATELLRPGVKLIADKDGVRNSFTSHAEVMLSLDGRPQENSGRVVGAALCYSGNYKLRVLTEPSGSHTLFAGIDEDNSAYHLRRGETFTTPTLAFTYSAQGLGGASRSFHRWGRRYRLCHGDRLRKILLNSWEGVYLNVSQERMNQMMADIADMGGELFVMDDGWFGTKYPRNTDSQGLGDWEVDKKKLPQGIEGLLHTAKEKGISFGIWIEPEMTNTKSELYETHPDWVVRAAGRPITTGRGGTQLVLDLGNPDVQDYVFGVVDKLMKRYPEIAYMKWDANMSILNHGSQYLPAAEQSHLYVNYHRGFETVCRRIRERYPDLTLQACASGGGRVNWGVLSFFDGYWTSDNTDALQRIYMQWGTSYFFPAIAMASHISASPNHQTGRRIPLKFRADVAMSGRLGLELQPSQLNEDERKACRQAIADYKIIRPVVQLGDLYRLLSPYDRQGAASLMYVSPEKDKAAYFWWQMEHFVGLQVPRVPMAGLDASRHYRIRELNLSGARPQAFEGKTLSGAYLMANGLEIGRSGEYASCVLYLEAVD